MQHILEQLTSQATTQAAVNAIIAQVERRLPLTFNSLQNPNMVLQHVWSSDTLEGIDTWWWKSIVVKLVNVDKEPILYNNPCDATIIVLQGGYTELRANPEYEPMLPAVAGNPIHVEVQRKAGDIIRRPASEFTTVASFEPNTYLLVLTNSKTLRSRAFLWNGVEYSTVGLIAQLNHPAGSPLNFNPLRGAYTWITPNSHAACEYVKAALTLRLKRLQYERELLAFDVDVLVDRTVGITVRLDVSGATDHAKALITKEIESSPIKIVFTTVGDTV